MLHIVPQRRPTAEQALKQPWLWTYTPADFASLINKTQTEQSQPQPTPENTIKIKGAVNATFQAISKSPQPHLVGPVVMSELARRRARDKSTSNMSNWSPPITHLEEEMGDYDVIFY